MDHVDSKKQLSAAAHDVKFHGTEKPEEGPGVSSGPAMWSVVPGLGTGLGEG